MMDEHTVAIVSFEGALKREVRKVRDRLQNLEGESSFLLEIKASGRIHDGDVKLTYNLAGGEYSGNNVKGDAIEPVVQEYMRRLGWNEIHQAKLLTSQHATEADGIPEPS